MSPTLGDIEPNSSLLDGVIPIADYQDQVLTEALQKRTHHN